MKILHICMNALQKIKCYRAGITEKSARKHWGIEDREIRWIIPEYMKKVIKILIYYKNLVDRIKQIFGYNIKFLPSGSQFSLRSRRELFVILQRK